MQKDKDNKYKEAIREFQNKFDQRAQLFVETYLEEIKDFEATYLREMTCEGGNQGPFQKFLSAIKPFREKYNRALAPALVEFQKACEPYKHLKQSGEDSPAAASTCPTDVSAASTSTNPALFGNKLSIPLGGCKPTGLNLSGV